MRFQNVYLNYPSFFAGLGLGPGPAQKDGKCMFFKRVFKQLSDILTNCLGAGAPKTGQKSRDQVGRWHSTLVTGGSQLTWSRQQNHVFTQCLTVPAAKKLDSHQSLYNALHKLVSNLDCEG